MKNLVLLFLLLVNGLQLFAQSSQIVVEATELKDNVNQAYGYKRLAEIGGTPYINENSAVGTFYLKNRTVVKTPTKLNMYYNGFEYLDNGKTYLVNSNTIDSVSLNNEIYVYREFRIDAGNSPKVVKIIDRKGDNRLYEYTSVILVSEVKAAGFVDPKPAQYEWKSPVYILDIAGNICALNNVNSVVRVFPKNESDIKKYFKENHVRVNNQDSLKKLLSYLSQLK